MNSGEVNCPAIYGFCDLRCSDCGGDVIEVCVEAVLYLGEVDRRVLTADLDEALAAHHL